MPDTGAAPRAAVAVPGAPTRAPSPASNARAAASRRNGARSRGPRTTEGKARSAQNALKHGLRAQKYVVLPDEDALEFAELQTALFEELAPVGALQTVLARRVAIAAWRLARADGIETELFAEHRWDGGDLGLALIRDGNGTRSFETLLRYRGAAMAEFLRALRTLKALQAGQAAGAEVRAMPRQPRAPARVASAPLPNEPEHRLPDAYVMPDQGGPGRTLHEAAASWMPNEPEAGQKRSEMTAGRGGCGRPSACS
jgi:hypothetical protein